MFYALMRKDLRMLRPVLVAAAIVVAFSNVMLPALSIARRAARTGEPVTAMSAARIWTELGEGALIGLALSTLLVAVCAAVGATTERRERWAEFSAMLPASGWRRTLVRLAVAVAAGLVICGLQLAIVIFAGRYGRTPSGLLAESQAMALLLLALGMFGFAWLASAFSRSPSVACAVGVGSVIAGLIAAKTADELYWASFSFVPRAISPDYAGLFAWTLALSGPAAILLGTVVSARRVSP